MNDVNFLRDSFENFTKASDSLKEAYANLEQKFAGINRELALRNRELEESIAEKDDMKNYLQSILESLTNGVIVTDLAGDIQTVNRCACAMIAVQEEDMIGKHIGLLFEDIKPEMWRDIFPSEYFKDEAGHKIRVKKSTLEIFGSPVRARGGQIVGTVFIFRDITRLEKLEDMAKRTEKLASMGEMAANIAHAIRNPLGGIELCASLLMKDLNDQKKRDRVAKIVALVKNMDNKISNLLLFTRTNIPHKECVNIRDILQETVLFAGQLAIEENISISLVISDEASVAGDREMLKQVFLNLMLNAFQAMPEGGRLHIETKLSAAGAGGPGFAPFVEIVFADNGIGIPEENLPKIFDPLFSTHEGTYGLGLAIVHNIVDMHRGAIHVERGEAGGTDCTVLLPLWDENVRAAS